jgi:hypothetical protein
VVPSARGLIVARARRPPTGSEAEVVRRAAAYLEAQGYRVYIDPDGASYFDLVARRGDEIGVVEAKIAEARGVLAQALRRRGWGDWSAVVLGSVRSARRLADRTATGRASPIGVWTLAGDGVEVVRPARPWVAPGAADPFAPLRARFLTVLADIDRGVRPAGLPWNDVHAEIRRASAGRWFGEWRLDEEPPGPPP